MFKRYVLRQAREPVWCKMEEVRCMMSPSPSGEGKGWAFFQKFVFSYIGGSIHKFPTQIRVKTWRNRIRIQAIRILRYRDFPTQKYKASWIWDSLLCCWFTSVPTFSSSPVKPEKAVFLPSEILIFWATHNEKDKKDSLTWYKQGIFRERQSSRILITRWNSAIWLISH